MANFSVIWAVSETLRVVLKNAIDPKNLGVTVAFLDVEKPPTDPTLTVFLFEVGEDPSARNHTRIRETEPPNLRIRKPPVALLLRYLLTAWGGNVETQQTILGLTIQALYDKAILSGSDLQKVLAGTDESLKVTMSPLSLEEHTRVWHAVQKPYRLSVAYEVRVVNLDSEITTDARFVTRRTLDSESLEKT